MTARRVVVLGVAALLVALAVLLAQSDARQAGSNSVVEAAEATEVPDSGVKCQAGETVPADATRLRLLVGTYGRPVPDITVTAQLADGTLVTNGRLPRGEREGHVEIPMRRVERTTTGAEVCIHVDGAQRTVLYGEASAVRLDWLRSGNESWFALIPTLAHRFALGKASLFGSLWLLVVAAVVLVACALAIRLLLRELGLGA
jgi:hypothetical protein